MRYLRRQVINRRDPRDPRLVVDANNSVLMTSPSGVQVPAGTTAQRPVKGQKYATTDTTDLSGFVRYNTTTNQLEGYQAGVWRAIRFKESVGIIQQLLGAGDGTNTVFGPLTPTPPTVIDVNTNWTANGNVTTPANVWSGANILVIVGNVFQIFNTNYVIQDGSAISIVSGSSPGPYTAGEKYVVFTSSVPGLSTEVYALHGFDR